MKYPSTCFAGRVIIREDRMGGLDWKTPCPIPPEEYVPTEPAMFFCVQHYDVGMAQLWHAFADSGLLDYDIVAGPRSPFEDLIEQLQARGSDGQP
jgi:hypothetical protein